MRFRNGIDHRLDLVFVGEISKPSVRNMSASTAVLVAAHVSVRCPAIASDVTCSAKESNPVPTAVTRKS
jgi:hypothetical protein